MRRLFIAAAALFSSIVSPHAQVSVIPQGPEWEKVTAAAKREKFVRVYSSNTPYALDRVFKRFKAAYPELTVEFLHIGGGAGLAKIDQESQSKLDGADLTINTTMSWWDERAAAGELLPFGPAAQGWPAQYATKSGVPIVALDPFGIVYNTDRIKTPPKSYADLLDPKYAGRVGTTPPVGATSTMFYDFLMEQVGPDFLTRLRAQRPKLYEGGDSNAQAVASGEIWASLWGDAGGVEPLRANGAPIAFAKPEIGFASQSYVAAFRWSKRPNAAQLFVNFLLSREGQEAWHGADNTSASARFDDIPSSISRKGIRIIDTTKYTPEVIRAARQEFAKQFRN